MFYKNNISIVEAKSKRKYSKQEKFFFARIQNLKLANLFVKISPRLKIVRQLKECSSVAYFEKIYCKETNSLLSQKLISHSCKHKFCSYCNHQKSKKLIKYFYENITKEELAQKNLIFLTITLPQHKIFDLKKNLQIMNKGWNKLKNYKKIKNVFLGSLKKNEVTRGKTTDKDQVHLHQHILIEVPKNYYKSDNYLTQKKLLSLIRKAYKLPIKIIDVRKVDNVAGEIKEILKYALKLQSFKKKEGETDKELASYLLTLASKLKGSRQISCSGTFKGAIKKSEELDELEELDDIETYKKYQVVITISLNKFFIGIETDKPPDDIINYLDDKKFIRTRKKVA